MTFETEEGKKRALNLNAVVESNEQLAHLNVWLETHSIQIEQASQPSDIIWENRHITSCQRLKKEICVFISIDLMLLASFAIMYKLTDFSDEILREYPMADVEFCETLPAHDNGHYT